MKVDAIDDRGRFADSAVFCPPSSSNAKDVSPGVAWSKGPPKTRSYALLMMDPDVPADLGLINKPGTIIARNAPRMRVFHWVLADIPPAITAIPAGVESPGLVPGGKPIGTTPYGLRGTNVFTSFLADVKGMAGTYGGYDGPCPPANDVRPHRYIVRVMALDIATLGLSGSFTGADLERASDGHVLAEGRAVGTYSLKPGAVK
ncbi:YbhB/YbcL family Raf kinase inhibitor-like protein [Faunimonas pinastri]|uniref:YbhB/YbcL family Raf kinase inhibitor-like protein n=1 Tax=Faunimonas pinastri TaxID=1855383 RepID=UPI001EEC222C|nr:YbhB/YbcL family Raf kinase inhibitor-like protein [Faunimonas pinastri]